MSNVNYRLGALGTLNLPGVANGNMAVGDLLAALKWTKENIAAFGGDPDRMTVAGQSAGAWYTVMLTGHPEASKLFKRSLALSYPEGASRRYRKKEPPNWLKHWWRSLDARTIPPV